MSVMNLLAIKQCMHLCACSDRPNSEHYQVSCRHTGWAKKWRTFLYTNNFVKYKPILNFFTVGIRRKFVVTLSLKISPHLKCVATLPSKISVFLKQQLKTRRYL